MVGSNKDGWDEKESVIGAVTVGSYIALNLTYYDEVNDLRVGNINNWSEASY